MVKMQTLEISELFYSIQGESTFSGFPCVFIRLSGCNLRCNYCDARYSFEEKSTRMSINSILEYVDKYPDCLVEITGGEPLEQENTHHLVSQLLLKNRRILIETNGSRDIAKVPLDATLIIDIKCPDSGSKGSFLASNLDEVRTRSTLKCGCCEIKFVISSQKDYEWSKNMVIQHRLHEVAPILFSPVMKSIDHKVLAELILRDKLPVRLQLQLHTFIWPEIERGV